MKNSQFELSSEQTLQLKELQKALSEALPPGVEGKLPVVHYGCAGGCSGTCENSCTWGCFLTCSGSCWGGCRGCWGTCRGSCWGDCQGGFIIG